MPVKTTAVVSEVHGNPYYAPLLSPSQGQTFKDNVADLQHYEGEMGAVTPTSDTGGKILRSGKCLCQFAIIFEIHSACKEAKMGESVKHSQKSRKKKKHIGNY